MQVLPLAFLCSLFLTRVYSIIGVAIDNHLVDDIGNIKIGYYADSKKQFIIFGSNPDPYGGKKYDIKVEGFQKVFDIETKKFRMISKENLEMVRSISLQVNGLVLRSIFALLGVDLKNAHNLMLMHATAKEIASLPQEFFCSLPKDIYNDLSFAIRDSGCLDILKEMLDSNSFGSMETFIRLARSRSWLCGAKMERPLSLELFPLFQNFDSELLPNMNLDVLASFDWRSVELCKALYPCRTEYDSIEQFLKNMLATRTKYNFEKFSPIILPYLLSFQSSNLERVRVYFSNPQYRTAERLSLAILRINVISDLEVTASEKRLLAAIKELAALNLHKEGCCHEAVKQLFELFLSLPQLKPLPLEELDFLATVIVELIRPYTIVFRDLEVLFLGFVSICQQSGYIREMLARLNTIVALCLTLSMNKTVVGIMAQL